ncbi:hypothetical protein BE17_13160 [Sorangium cellulosum]|uniref:ATPase AAA-type core domain-containing protein n=1 Tax=Sorangium cellulosum TaxID=56 RepID=A0A150REV3_SORCE|nr:hypothetical protein BE17_13160 [Sorangium cellulosum]
MRLQWFEVEGYKNIRTPLRLAELGDINVLHGDNNVGKSNLLEAIGLFFLLVRALREDTRGGPGLRERHARKARRAAAAASGRSVARSFDYFVTLGFPPDDIFDLNGVRPIRLSAQIELDPDDVDSQEPAWLGQPLELTLGLERREDELLLTLVRAARADGVELSSEGGEAADDDLTRVLERLGPRRGHAGLVPRFALIRADRTVLTELALPAGESAPLETREPLPREIGLALHDAETATGPLRERFDIFAEALGRFRPLVGEGQWRMIYDRRADRAELSFEGSGGRIPLRLMGSGIQQIAVLLARLLLTSADVAAVEEPELNLRWAAQHLLREALAAIAGARGGPSQMFVTSHSPAFEFAPSFYLIERTPEGPSISRRPKEQAPLLLSPDVETPPAGARAPLSYVTTEGLVRLPDHVREELGLLEGGGVAFVREKNHGHYRLLTDAQFLDLLEPRGSEP